MGRVRRKAYRAGETEGDGEQDSCIHPAVEQKRRCPAPTVVPDRNAAGKLSDKAGVPSAAVPGSV